METSDSLFRTFCRNLWKFEADIIKPKEITENPPILRFTLYLYLVLQPFRGNPNYDTVANLPYDSKCLAGLTTGQDEINIKSISKCRMETMYDTACMNSKVWLKVLQEGILHICNSWKLKVMKVFWKLRLMHTVEYETYTEY